MKLFIYQAGEGICLTDIIVPSIQKIDSSYFTGQLDQQDKGNYLPLWPLPFCFGFSKCKPNSLYSYCILCSEMSQANGEFLFNKYFACYSEGFGLSL